MAVIAEKSHEDFTSVQLNKWRELQPDIDINTDSMVYMDAVVMAEIAYMVQGDAIIMSNNAFLAFATGDELSNLGADRGINRQPATQAEGVLRFSRAAKAATDYAIASGSQVSSQPAGDGSVIKFATTEEATLYGTVPDVSSLAGSQTTGGVLDSNTEYHYKVNAVDNLGNATASGAAVSFTTPSGSNNHQVDLTWDASPRAAAYLIYVASGAGQEDEVKLLAQVTVPYYSDLVGQTASPLVPEDTNNTGALSVLVNAEAVSAGASGNLAAQTITQLIDHPTGIENVTNPSGFAGGADQEDDDAYRNRIKDRLTDNTGKVTKTGYEQTAEAVVGVQNATVYLPYPSGQRNEIWVYITSESGTGVASDALVALVQATMSADENRAPTDNITVLTPSTNAVNVTVEILEYESGVSEADTRATVEANLEAYFPTIAVGAKIYLNDLKNVVHDTSGVKDYSMTLPAANIQLADNEMAIAGVITIS